MDELNYVGYIKYEGRLVDEGLMDARKAAQALIGFDEIIKFYLARQASQFQDRDYELPVLIKHGSWAIEILQNVSLLIAGSATIAGTTYLTTAAKKMAERDFEEFGFKDIFRKTFEALQWTIRIGKHVKDITKKKFTAIKFADKTNDVGIPNENGDYLYVPKEFFDLYFATSPKLLEKMALLIEPERKLVVGVVKNGKEQKEEIPYSARRIFTQEEDPDEILFPELAHGMYVELEGELTRGNETANTLGFKYKGHIPALLRSHFADRLDSASNLTVETWG